MTADSAADLTPDRFQGFYPWEIWGCLGALGPSKMQRERVSVSPRLVGKPFHASSFRGCIHTKVQTLRIVRWWNTRICDSNVPTQCAHGVLPSHFVRSWLHWSQARLILLLTEPLPDLTFALDWSCCCWFDASSFAFALTYESRWRVLPCWLAWRFDSCSCCKAY